MAMESEHPSDEEQIRALVADRVKGVHEKNVAALVARIAPDVVSFDALPSLQRIGSGAVKVRLEEWFGWYNGPIDYEVRDLRITAGEDVAFASYL